MKTFAIGVLSALVLATGIQAAKADCPSCTKPTTTVSSGIEGQALKHALMGTAPPKPIPPSPIKGAQIVVKDAKTGKEVASVKTDKDGKFKLTLPPGEYKVTGKQGKWSFDHKVKVTANTWSDLKGMHFRYNGPLPPVQPHKGPPPVQGISGQGIAGQAIQYPVFGNAPTFPVPPSAVGNVELIATDTKTGKEVARVTTDKDGNFRLSLRPGEYEVKGSNGKHWNYNAKFKVTSRKWEQVKAEFRYSGPPIPSAGGPVRK